MGEPSGDVATALGEIVGAAHVAAGEPTAVLAIDGRAPRWVVSPGGVDEVSRCLALASARGLTVVPIGGAARLGWGNPPRAYDLALSLRRLDRILAHEPADLTMSVEAGATLTAINRVLRPHRQILPLDPARADDSTVGGIIATAAGGPYRARYGTIRELLLGLTVVQADGTVVKGGGRVVKNATGYDMPKLYVGALGTLGVVVTAHLRLHPVPAVEATWLFAFDSPEAALEAALGIMDAPLVVSRLELLDRSALRTAGEASPSAAALGVTVGSVPEAVRAQGERVAEVCRRGGGAGRLVAEPERWWRQAVESTWPTAPDDLCLRIGVRPTDLVKALRAVESAAGPRSASRAIAEVVNGVLHVTLGGVAPDQAAPVVTRAREALAGHPATCVVEQAPPAAKASLDVWGDVGPALVAMRQLKSEMDRHGILNPGRYVGGI